MRVNFFRIDAKLGKTHKLGLVVETETLGFALARGRHQSVAIGRN